MPNIQLTDNVFDILSNMGHTPLETTQQVIDVLYHSEESKTNPVYQDLQKLWEISWVLANHKWEKFNVN